jgi:hypothetical protein
MAPGKKVQGDIKPQIRGLSGSTPEISLQSSRPCDASWASLSDFRLLTLESVIKMA